MLRIGLFISLINSGLYLLKYSYLILLYIIYLCICIQITPRNIPQAKQTCWVAYRPISLVNKFRVEVFVLEFIILFMYIFVLKLLL